MLTEPGYQTRLIDAKIERYLRLFGALALEGPKWCGKTWTALNHANSVVYILDPENGYANRESAKLNPAAILTGEKPLLIDEWQEVPGIWDAVRYASDRTRSKGQFILTGSVTPQEGSYVHSGAGRIGRIQLRTMSLYESGDSSGIVSLQALFHGETVTPNASSLTQDKLISLVTRGGWPENIRVSIEDAGILPAQYLQALAASDISNADNKRRNPALVMHLLAALARTNMTPALQNTITADVQSRFGEVTRQTVAGYLSILKRLFVVEEIPQWYPDLRDKLILRKTPKRMLSDPSIAVSALKANPNDLSRDPRTLGGIFENLCMRDFSVYADVIDAKLSHYHDATGLEIDAILELGNKWAALEIKLGAHRVDEGAAALFRLKNKVTQKGAPQPAFLCVVTGGGPLYRREDGIFVIPIDCWRP